MVLTRGWVCRLQLLLALASAFILRSESRRTRVPQPGGQVPVFISPRNGGPVIPRALGYLSVAFYDSQGCGGGDLNPYPHPGGSVCYAVTHKFEVG
jgi:hypothetical protein